MIYIILSVPLLGEIVDKNPAMYKRVSQKNGHQGMHQICRHIRVCGC
jgi:hypothetical protein